MIPHIHGASLKGLNNWISPVETGYSQGIITYLAPLKNDLLLPKYKLHVVKYFGVGKWGQIKTVIGTTDGSSINFKVAKKAFQFVARKDIWDSFKKRTYTGKFSHRDLSSEFIELDVNSNKVLDQTGYVLIGCKIENFNEEKNV